MLPKGRNMLLSLFFHNFTIDFPRFFMIMGRYYFSKERRDE